MGGRVKNEGAKKRSSKTVDIVSYALKVGVNGDICVTISGHQAHPKVRKLA